MSWKDFRTSIAGILTIGAGIASFVGGWIAHGFPSAEHWALLGSALTAGAGLIAAADGKPVQ